MLDASAAAMPELSASRERSRACRADSGGSEGTGFEEAGESEVTLGSCGGLELRSFSSSAVNYDMQY